MPELNERQSAEPNQCGSCQHYESRRPGDGFGICGFKFPPHVAVTQYLGERDSMCNERTVRDTDTCSLYKIRNLAGEPVEFVQQRVWQAGMPSR